MILQINSLKKFIILGAFLLVLTIIAPHTTFAAGEFKTTWRTTTPSETITIPTVVGLTYNYTIDWGDTTSTAGATGNATHTYATAGDYQVSITGTFPAIQFASAGDKDKIRSVDQWGTNVWATMYDAFFGCSNLAILATDAPDLSAATDMTYMLRGSGVTNEDLSGWNVSNVTTMIGVFQDTAFNGNISTWATTNVVNMVGLFYGDAAFNGNIGSWNVSNVTSMNAMFYGDTAFNQDIHLWSTGSVTDMAYMFYGASSFNQSIGIWSTINVTNMQSMFAGATSFNRTLNALNVASVTNMANMFYHATAFNQNLNSWNVSSVTNMNSMFEGATAFNGTLVWGNYTANVTNMQGMFTGASSFNQDISGWNTGNVTNMTYMFTNAVLFNQPIGSWNVSKVTNLGAMFLDAHAFNQPLNSWDVSHVTNLGATFDGTYVFNQPLNNWDVSHVTYMGNTFEASAFNQNIGGWNTASLTDMYAIFAQNASFNQDISFWDTSHVTNMDSAFYYTTAFDRDLSRWNVGQVTNMNDMFNGVTLSTANYDALINSWRSQTVQSNVTFHGGNSVYCSSALHRRQLVDVFGWTITDGGSCANPPVTTTTVSTEMAGGFNYGCTDPKAVNYQSFTKGNSSLCKYESPNKGSVASNVVMPTSRILKYGVNGVDVKNLQMYLNTHNFPVTTLGKETQYFGLKTKTAVAAFQKSHMLPADGVVGPKTFAIMQ